MLPESIYSNTINISPVSFDGEALKQLKHVIKKNQKSELPAFFKILITPQISSTAKKQNDKPVRGRKQKKKRN